MIPIVETATSWAFAQVIMIDLVLAGDNAVVIGMATAGLPVPLRRKAIFYGIIGATVTVQLLAIVGLLLAGGLLLLWVAWKLWEELHTTAKQESWAEEALTDTDLDADGRISARLLNRHRWIAYVGLLVIVFVALRMIVQGADELMPHADAVRAFIF